MLEPSHIRHAPLRLARLCENGAALVRSGVMCFLFPSNAQDKSAPKKKPAEKKDNEILPAVGAGDDDDEDFAHTAKKAKR